MVLFLFVIMLLNLQHVSEPATRPIQQFLGYAGSAFFGLVLVYYLVKYAVMQLPSGPFQSDARHIGVALFEAYIFPFEMVSILLLAAIVGALMLSGRAVGQRAELGS
jgi:NADH:ubiquinone oxidoreductase subunit 6 (subunit J)